LSAAWYRASGARWLIDVHAQPGAKRSEISGLHGERLKVRIAAPAVDGRANEALERYLAERLGVPRGAVRVVKGDRSRDKRVAVDAPDAAPDRLIAASQGTRA
jgi:uncharacterized protein (TIGR00251 family)